MRCHRLLPTEWKSATALAIVFDGPDLTNVAEWSYQGSLPFYEKLSKVSEIPRDSRQYRFSAYAEIPSSKRKLHVNLHVFGGLRVALSLPRLRHTA